MKRSFRRCKRKIERQIDNIQSRATHVFNRNIRPSFRSTFSTPISAILSREESDDETERNSSIGSSHNLTIRSNSHDSLIPCQFCGESFSTREIQRHQYGCERHYPVRNRRRPPIPARQVVSESESSEEVFLPSAPPRSSSPALLPMECFEISNRLLCPITFQLFEDPVVATDGHTYERAAILRCISSSQRSPLTRDPLISNQLVPTRLVKDMADEVRDSIRIARSMYKYQLDFHFEKREEIGPEDSSVQRKEFAVHWIKQQERLNDENCVLIYFGGENATKLAEIHRKLTIYPHLIRLYGQVRNKENEILFLQERNTRPSLNEFLNQNTPVNVLKRILSQIALTLIFLSEHSINYGRISKSFVYIQEGFENCEDLLIKLDKVSNYLLLDEEDLKNEDLAPEFRKSLIYTEKSDVYAFGRFVQQIYPTEDLTDEQKHFLYCCLDEEPTSRPNVSELNSFFVL